MEKLSSKQKEKNASFKLAMEGAKAKKARIAPELDVSYGSLTDSPEVFQVKGRGRKFLTPSSSQSRETILKSFMNDNKDLFGMEPQQVARLKKIGEYTNPNGKLSWLRLEQRMNGMKVFQGETLAAFSSSGEMVRVVGDTTAGLVEEEFPTEPKVSAAAAVVAAAASLDFTLSEDQLAVKETSQDGRRVVFHPVEPFTDDIEAELMYFPMGAGMATLAWSMVLWEEIPAYYVLVDAEDAAGLLWRKPITNEQTQTATYSVYNDDSPAPLSPSNAFPGSGIQGAAIPRTPFTIISELPAFDNLGWITDGVNTTTGNNVDAGLDIVAPNGIDVDGRAIGSPFRVFDFPYNPAPGIPPPGDAPTLADYRRGVVTQLFFWSNRYHDRLYELGFTEAARNFQQDNFGRGGLGNDFVRAEAQDFISTNNANFATPADGSLPRMQMFIFTGPNPDRDGDLDQEIVLHELTHGTSNRLHANATGLGANVSGGMGEGWSDYYARALLSSADEDVNGVYASGAYATLQLSSIGTDNYYYGIRRFPYAVKTAVGPNGKPHNPLTFADTDPAQLNTTDGAFPESPLNFSFNGATEVHNLGEIWCMTLLEMRARLITRLGFATGNQRDRQLVTAGMKLDPVSPNMLQGRDSILAADCAGFGGQDELDIWAGFAARGMGYSAKYNSTFSVSEAFDMPNLNLGAVTISNDSCEPPDGFPDPGESLTLNIPLSNPFCATGANEVSISVEGGGSVSYGDIPAGETVLRGVPFTVPSDAACESQLPVNVVITSSLGIVTRTFNLQIGRPVATITNTYSSGNLSVPINDNSTVDIPINVTNGGAVADVNVKVRLNHTFDADLTLTLIGPDGTSVVLAGNRGGAGDNFGTGSNDCSGVHTVFDDSASTPIGEGTAPFAGSFRPDSPLSAFNGKRVNGIWILRVTDGFDLDTGTVGCFQLEINRQRFTCCGAPGTPEIQPAPPATLVSESCAPGNGAPDPGETVTVNCPLLNVGAGDTTNLVATLLEGGGVLAPSGPQTYGVLVSDGPAVARPFTFTVAGVCGGDLTATLALQDGVTSLGTVTFTIRIGAFIVRPPRNYSSGNIAVPLAFLTTVEIPFNVNDVGILGDVNVKVRLNYNNDAALEMTLIGPDGTSVALVRRGSAAGQNFGAGANDCSGVHTVFDDSASTPIGQGTAPFAGSFKPDSPLSAFNGRQRNGIWTLRLTGVVLAFNFGTLGCVQLEIASQQLACCGVPGTPEIQAAPPVTVVNESCAPGNGAPDADETVMVNFPLLNVGAGDTTNLVATLLEGGGVLAPSGPQTYGVLASDGPAVARPFTFTVARVCGGDLTATLALQDGATSLGTVTFTIRIGMTITTSSFSNTAPIIIPATGLGDPTGAPSNPYPSTINVSGVTGTVTKVTVQLFRFGHGWTSDVDVLLVGPGGQKLLLMSNVGLTVQLPPWISTGGGDLTFDDAAPPMPINAKIVSGTYKPTNSGTGDLFPAPAPPGPYPDPQQLSVYNGVNPNGTWRLFVVDDFPHFQADGERGSIFGGWRLNITTTDTVCPTPVVSTISGQYSDVVMLKANVANVTCPGGSVQFNVNGSVVGSAPVLGGEATLPYKILFAQGSYPVLATYFTSTAAGRSGSGTLTVTREDVIVTPAASIPAAVQVRSRRGTAGPINLCAAIAETNDESPGDIALATPVTFTLPPVAPGAQPITKTADTDCGVGGTLTVCAAFNNVPVNVYDVGISVGGNNYTGSAGASFAVFDPSLGSFKAVGAIVRNGRPATFLFNVKYRKNGTPQGGLLYVESLPSGRALLQASAVQSLSIVGNTGVIVGRAIVNGVGNHTFRATVVDSSKSGRGDRFGLQVVSPSGAVIPDLTFDPITLRGGNIKR